MFCEISKKQKKMAKRHKVTVEASKRHVHLSRKEIDKLFGKGYSLKISRELSQPGQFAAEERVHLINGDRIIENVRVLGPEREKAQVELSDSDARQLGIDAPIRGSGDHKDTLGIKLEGPKGSVLIKKGVIKAQRHLHASDEEAKRIWLRNGQTIKIMIPHSNVTFKDVLVRVHPKYRLAVHLDSDEAGIADIERTALGELILEEEDEE